MSHASQSFMTLDDLPNREWSGQAAQRCWLRLAQAKLQLSSVSESKVAVIVGN